MTGGAGSSTSAIDRGADQPAKPAASSADTDDILVGRARAGDALAYDALVRRHIRRATVIARALLGNVHDAEDLVQDAFIRAYDRLGTLDVSRGGFAPWFFRLLGNAAHNARESRRVRQTEPEARTRAVASTAPDPHLDAERDEIRRRFAVALAELPPRQRAIVMMYDVEGMTSAEIADLFDLRPETVRWHLHKARAQLRIALAAIAPGRTEHER